MSWPLVACSRAAAKLHDSPDVGQGSIEAKKGFHGEKWLFITGKNAKHLKVKVVKVPLPGKHDPTTFSQIQFTRHAAASAANWSTVGGRHLVYQVTMPGTGSEPGWLLRSFEWKRRTRSSKLWCVNKQPKAIRARMISYRP